jgi:hypothetical protein
MLSGLPDGLFSNQKSHFGKFWRALEWKILEFFYDKLGYFTAIWYTLWPFGICSLWPFGIVCGNLVYFSRFGMFGSRKIWQPCNVVGELNEG